MLAVDEVMNQREEIEAIKMLEDGKLLILVPRLIEQMTKPDRVSILEWQVQEGEIVRPDEPMLTIDFLGDDWYLPVPPLEGLARVISIKAVVGETVHLDDPLVVLELIMTI